MTFVLPEVNVVLSIAESVLSWLHLFQQVLEDKSGKSWRE